MTALSLTQTRIQNGICRGFIIGAKTEPQLELVCGDIRVDTLELTPSEQGWHLAAPLPQEALNDGICTFLVTDTETDTNLGHFTVAVGTAIPDDLRAEVDLLRAELDMLKRAFRRHCSSTDQE